MPELPIQTPILPPEGLLELSAPEPPIKQDFLVYYQLGGLMVASALSGQDASGKVFALLKALVGKAANQGVSPAEASQVRLGDLDVEIESVEAIEFPHDGPLVDDGSMPRFKGKQEPDELREFFDIYASISRADLQKLGFDANNITDADMEKLARKMTDNYLEQLFWVSVRITAENLRFPTIKLTPS